jgi:DNA-binding MarR family transcriptional regulator
VRNQTASRESVRRLSNELLVLSARLVRDVRRHNSEHPAASTRLMSLLDELGPSTISALAQHDRCSQPTMTGLVNGLVERGWVERRPHPDDARAQLVTMTEAGRAHLSDVRRRNAALIAERIEASGRTPEDLATAVAVLTDLLRTTS